MFRFVDAPRSYEWLLRYKCVSGWASCYREGTRDGYLYRLEGFLRLARFSDPRRLLRLRADPNWFYSALAQSSAAILAILAFLSYEIWQIRKLGKIDLNKELRKL